MKKDGWRLDSVGPRQKRALTIGLIASLVVGASAIAYLYPSGLRFPVAIHADPPGSLADSPLHLWITGLRPNQTVTVIASTLDWDGQPWHAYATMAADRDGSIDLSKAVPLEGTYRQADSMGLFWSMVPWPPADRPHPPPGQYQVALTVRAGGRVLARSSASRIVAGHGVTVHDERADTVGFDGKFFAPGPAGARSPGVLILGASDDSPSPHAVLAAALLASHGYPSLDLAYPAASGRAGQEDMPAEYLAKALVWLRRQQGVDPGHILAYGTGSASEMALLLAVQRPDLVQGTIALVPGDAASDVPVEQIGGPILLVCGEADRTWASCRAAQAIQARRDAAKQGHVDAFLMFPDAGHGIGQLVPYQPGTTFQVPSAEGAANAIAAARAWPALLAFLARQR
jgi:dienelactone hydrolase